MSSSKLCRFIENESRKYCDDEDANSRSDSEGDDPNLTMLCPLKKCKLFVENEDATSPSDLEGDDPNLTKLCPLKKCKFVENEDANSPSDSEGDDPNLSKLCPLKRCKFVENEDANSPSDLEGDDLNLTKLCPLKKCKFVENEDANSPSDLEGDDPNLSKLCPLKMCKFVENEDAKNPSDLEGDDLNLTKLCPLKKCKFVDNENRKGDSCIQETKSESFLSYNDKTPPKCRLRRCKFVDKGNTVESELESSFESQLKHRQLDVISFLSNNGKTTYLVRSNGQFVALDSIRGKYLVICCVSLPVTSDDQHWRAIMATYSELPQTNFEMVVVPSGNNKADFFRCLSHVPCLAIPFSDKLTRKSICSSIGFNLHSNFDTISTILVDPSGRILRCCWTPQLFHDYGSEWFYRNEVDIHLQDIIMRLRLDPLYKYNDECLPEAINRAALFVEPLSLHKDILLCKPSQKLFRFGGGQSSTVSELSNKYVGLYLCINRQFLKKLNEIHRQCLANNLELEIVLVCLPLFEDTKLYHKLLINALKGCKIKSWFIFPYEHKICRRLWRVFSQKWKIDRMIILPPNGKSGELEGRTVVEQLGINAYPFIRSRILEKRFTALKSLTPTTWFKGTRERHTCLVHNWTKANVPQSAIEGKKLLLYLDWLVLPDGIELLQLLMKHYSEIKDMGCEVVFVPLDFIDNDDQYQPHVELTKMPWPIMPVSAATKASVVNQLIFRSKNYQLIAFEENGEIVSTQAMKRLKKRGVTDYLFHDELRKEVTAELTLLENEEGEY